MKKALIILVLVIIFTYVPSFFGKFLWDDEDFVYANQYVATFDVSKFFSESATAGRGKSSNYYRPVQLASYATEHTLFGFNPFIFHVSNVLWHVGAVVMLFLVFCSIGVPLWIAFCVALIFGIHPVQTEAVSYVSGRSDMMYVFFLCSSFLLFIRKKSIAYVGSLILFVCALLSKESALISVVIVPLLLWVRGDWKKEVRRLMPFIFIVICYLLLRMTTLEFVSISSLWGTDTPYATNVIVRLATFMKNYFEYWRLMLFPWGLHMERDLTTKIMETVWNWWSVAFVCVQVGVLGYLFYAWKRKIDGFRFIVLGWLGMNAILLFYSGIILLNGIFYEHYLFFAIPFAFLFLWGLTQSVPRKILFGAFIVYCLLFIFINIRRQYDWINPIRFYTQTLERAPQSVRIRNGLAMAYAEEKQYKNAEREYLHIIKEDSLVPHAYHNLANLYSEIGKEKEAESYYKKAISVAPQFYFSYVSLIKLYEKLGEREKKASVEGALQQISQ